MGNRSTRARYWPFLLARAGIAALAAIIVTFSADHTPPFGLAVLGAYALVGGLLTAATASRAGLSRSATVLTTVQGVAGAAVGVAALLSLATGASLAALVVLAAMWAIVSGALELTVGVLRTDASSLSRDRIFVGALGIVLAVAVILGRDNPVVVVGCLGAYAAIVAVYNGIAAFTLKWETGAEAASASDDPRTAVHS